jgi:Fe-S cluster assembly protein SufD
LNTALLLKVYINIPKAKSLTNLSKSCISQLEEAALMVQPRNLVIVGENSHVQIIERHQSLNENCLTNSVTEIFAQNELS